MDQSAFAGVGNIYRAEALYRAGIDPYRPGREVSREEFLDMWSDLVELMRDGVRRGRIDTVRDEHTPRAMGRPRRRDRHGGEVYVYRREDASASSARTRSLGRTWRPQSYWCRPVRRADPGQAVAAGTCGCRMPGWPGGSVLRITHQDAAMVIATRP